MNYVIDAHDADLNAREIRGAYMARAIGHIVKAALALVSAKAVHLSHALGA